MKTKLLRGLFLVLLVIGFSTNIYAQENTDTANANLTRQQKKELRKKQQKADNLASFERAKEALESGNWVLQADRLYDRYGFLVNVTPASNFVSLEDSTAYLQLSFPHAVGPNGLGGVTYKGNPTKITMKENKKGNITYKMSVLGTALTADITVRLNAGTNTADAQVNLLTAGGRVRMAGELLPVDGSTAYRSRYDW